MHGHVPRKACSLGLSLWFFVLVICRYMCLIRWIRQGQVINAEQRASLDDAIQPHSQRDAKDGFMSGGQLQYPYWFVGYAKLL